MAQGTTTVNFGEYPGTDTVDLVITGQTGIGAGSLVEAWIFPVATADHSLDEHTVEGIDIFAHSVVAGTGFTIRLVSRTTQLYGQWTVAWVWN